ncbi:MAG: HD domain-containing phosphohydrolase [Planctomycetota bacterium]
MTSPSPLASTTLPTGSTGNTFPAPSINAPLVADEKLVFGDQEAAASSGIVDASPADVPPGKIMIVDDEVANVLVAKKLLSRAGHREFETTTDSTRAVNLVHTYQPDVVLLDINMPHVDGISILSQIRSVPKLQHLPVLILTANHHAEVKLRCLELGATDFLVKPIDPMELAPRVRNALQNKLYHDQLESHAAELEETVRRRTQDLERSRREVIYCLARAAELRDNDTGNHVIRVGRYAGIIAERLNLPERFVRDLELAAQLHDVGKIAIPDAILLKPGKLEPEEYELIQGHVKHGRQIIKPFGSDDIAMLRDHVRAGADILGDSSSLMRLAASIAQTHHEKFDGSGYPIGLAGDDIPIEGRITAVADVFDALASERPYKRALPREKCFEILEEGRGKHFDPDVLDAFFEGTNEIVRVQLEFMDYLT